MKLSEIHNDKVTCIGCTLMTSVGPELKFPDSHFSAITVIPSVP